MPTYYYRSLRESISLAKRLLADWWCFSFHRKEVVFGGAGSHLCACGREWFKDSCISRNWKADLDALADGYEEEMF